MIKLILSKKDYYEYIKCDEKAIKCDNMNFLKKHTNPIWKFERVLRKHEYYNNCCKRIYQKILKNYYRYIHKKLGIKYGFSIPINVFGKGLSIAHVGTIVVNSGAVVGDNCRLHVCTNIGTAAGKEHDAPTIGNNVYIAPGAKIFGKIKIPNNVIIGANSVVNKSFDEENITIGGIPAKKISDKGTKELYKDR